MITSGEWLNPTRAVGLVAYGAAVVSCGLAWMRARRRGRNGQLAGVLTLIEGMLLLDITFDWRWRLHAWAGELAQRHHVYEQRRGPQSIVLIVLAGLLLVGLLAVMRVYREQPGAWLAITGALISLVTWCVEVVSLHAVDHVLYFPLGPFFAITLIWVSGCVMTAVGVRVERSPRSQNMGVP